MATLPYWSKADLAKFLSKRLCTSCKNRGVSTIAEAMACTSCRVFKRRGRPPSRDHIADNNAAGSTQNTQLLDEELLYAAANTASNALGMGMGSLFQSQTQATAFELLASTAVGAGTRAQTYIAACDAARHNTGAVGVAGLSAVADASLPFVHTPFRHTASNTSSNVRPAAAYPRSVHVCVRGE